MKRVLVRLQAAAAAGHASPRACICAGKSEIASYLIEEHGFTRLRLARPTAAPRIESSASRQAVVDAQHTFPDIDSLLDFVTLRWREQWVTTDIWDDGVVDALMKRPFFLLVSVDAPFKVRWQRYQTRRAANQLPPPDIMDFVDQNDEHSFAPKTGLGGLSYRAQLKLLDNTASIESLRNAIRALDLTDHSRLRPSWDQYFMQLADLAAHRSNCMKRRVGCCVVRNKRVISTGYNGTPRKMTNCNEGGCGRCNNSAKGGTDLNTCLCLHAEENALLEAGHDRIGENAILYCNTCPCVTCSVKITQVGITEVVYNQGYLVDDQTARIFKESGVKLRQFTPPTGGLVDLGMHVHQEKPTDHVECVTRTIAP
ncbi:deoxycytidylate deaminase [Stemphylium lycopersici]|uniref:Deoxycytidylate deaminase n=1 Tax=Stemphylium lycopersici TaxID=183478 RepID=A0A364NBC2_STELY|nr:deoxycytidylate deaminase [Stemphylium lycopersici]RAR10717.1 deoxycytidylate deaminase [Stemphylium lycopersici]RAR14605.1 deoxycytidylate deaminase [Stemphylium lycopersici]